MLPILQATCPKFFETNHKALSTQDKMILQELYLNCGHLMSNLSSIRNNISAKEFMKILKNVNDDRIAEIFANFEDLQDHNLVFETLSEIIYRS